MKTNAVNFTGFIQYTSPKNQIAATLDTKNILGIQQKKENGKLCKDETKILIKNTHDNNKKYPYAVISVPNLPINYAIMEYNKTCNNEFADLGRVIEIEYLQDRKGFVV